MPLHDSRKPAGESGIRGLSGFRRVSENESVHTALSAGRYPEHKAGHIMQRESILTCPSCGFQSVENANRRLPVLL
jgi:hypothetical protein